MSGQNNYILAFLPGLDDLDSAPPIQPASLLASVEDMPRARQLLEALFMSDDLLQWQAYQAGEIKVVDPAVLTEAQTTGQEALPDWLTNEEEEGKSHSDEVWQNYYRRSHQVARHYGCEFLSHWIEYEVSMKNALVLARSKALNLDPADYLAAEELGDSHLPLAGLINEWSNAANPLQGLRLLDEARWRWIGDNDTWFSFKDDEILAYGARVMLLGRWHRLSGKASARALNA